MNKSVDFNQDFTKRKGKTWRENVLQGRIKDVITVGILAFVLLFASWRIFYGDDTIDNSLNAATTQSENRVRRLLEEMEGVGKAEVMVCETEDKVSGVVVVCDGASDIQVMIQVKQAVAAALGIQEKAVKIYQKKE